MMLLFYIPPIFAGIIGSRYLGRLANFCLMVAVFQIDLGLIGQFNLGIFISPYTVICILPAVAGLFGDRCFHMGKFVNALLIAAVFYVGGVLLAFHNRGRFIPLLFLQTMSVTAGFLVPPLIFIVVARVAYRLRPYWRV